MRDFGGRDGGDVEDGIRLGQGVITGVVAEQDFVAQRLTWVLLRLLLLLVCSYKVIIRR
jgi:hypothetical protein